MVHKLLLLGVLVVAVGVLVALVRTIARKPALGPFLVLLAIAFVPVWITLPVNPYIPPATAIAYIALIGLLPRMHIEITGADLLVFTIFLLVALSRFAGSDNTFVASDLWLGALPAYLLGRVAVRAVGLRRLSGWIAGIWCVIAALAIIEWLTNTNLFTTYLVMHNDLYTTWGEIQSRAGLSRAEGAFGHSIALGTSLAVGIPFAAAAPWRSSHRIGAIALITLATAPTLSRTGMLCAAVAVVLTLLLLRTDMHRRWRVGALSVLAAAAAVVLPKLLVVFAEAGTEQSGSAAYRGDLLSLVHTLVPLGMSSAAQHSSTGITWNGFDSVDDELLLAALRFGWVPVVLAIIGILVMAVHVLSRRASPAHVAVVALIPAYVTVAFITQLGTVVWLMAGIAVASYAHREEPWGSVDPDVLAKASGPRRRPRARTALAA